MSPLQTEAPPEHTCPKNAPLWLRVLQADLKSCSVSLEALDLHMGVLLHPLLEPRVPLEPTAAPHIQAH